MKFFDMDGTICESRQKIRPEIKKALMGLKCPIAVISGASREQMLIQLDGLRCIKFAQSGNDTQLWKNELNHGQKRDIWRHVSKLGYPIDEKHLEDRGCQMAYSFIGHNADQALKLNFDPDQKLRKWFLRQFPFKSKTLTVRIGGTTCLDYTHKNGTKGKNIERWIKETGLKKKDCVYYGDALFKGGNDESVLGVIKCIEVKNPNDLLKKL